MIYCNERIQIQISKWKRHGGQGPRGAGWGLGVPHTPWRCGGSTLLPRSSSEPSMCDNIHGVLSTREPTCTLVSRSLGIGHMDMADTPPPHAALSLILPEVELTPCGPGSPINPTMSRGPRPKINKDTLMKQGAPRAQRCPPRSWAKARPSVCREWAPQVC